jgi:hypothetical protein
MRWSKNRYAEDRLDVRAVPHLDLGHNSLHRPLALGRAPFSSDRCTFSRILLSSSGSGSFSGVSEISSMRSERRESREATSLESSSIRVVQTSSRSLPSSNASQILPLCCSGSYDPERDEVRVHARAMGHEP